MAKRLDVPPPVRSGGVRTKTRITIREARKLAFPWAVVSQFPGSSTPQIEYCTTAEIARDALREGNAWGGTAKLFHVSLTLVNAGLVSP